MWGNHAVNIPIDGGIIVMSHFLMNQVRVSELMKVWEGNAALAIWFKGLGIFSLEKQEMKEDNYLTFTEVMEKLYLLQSLSCCLVVSVLVA